MNENDAKIDSMKSPEVLAALRRIGFTVHDFKGRTIGQLRALLKSELRLIGGAK